jgi:hypothetical protein
MLKKINLEKFSQIPVLKYKKIIFNVYNFNHENLNFSHTEKFLKAISQYEKVLIERTEQQMILNIIFEENCLKNKNLRIYEDIAWHFYSQCLLTKYINSKDFIISFPQLFNRDIHFNSKEEDIEAIFSLNSSEDQQGNLIEYLEKNNPNSNKIKDKIYNLEDIKLDVALLPRKININPINTINSVNYIDYKNINSERKIFNIDENEYRPIDIGKYKSTVCGGSFDHAHIGHNLLLTTASLLSSDMIYVGLTSNKMVSKKDDQFILQPFELREMKIRKALNHIGYKKNIRVKQKIE